MYYFLVSGNGWDKTSDTLPEDRVFEYTDDSLIDRFYDPGGDLNISSYLNIPAIFIKESTRNEIIHADIGFIHSAEMRGDTVYLKYGFDTNLPKVTNQELMDMADLLGIKEFEFHRTHLSVKDVDLFKVLFERSMRNFPKPKVFKLDKIAKVDDNLISMMMPFSAEFNEVNQVVKKVAKDLYMECLRADDIWEHPTIMQDVFYLISRSKIVICDCTGRNSNVFYEAGIAHTLGREVILIAQSKEDIPFDLRHFRYVEYVNDAVGLNNLSEKLKLKITSIINEKQ